MKLEKTSSRLSNSKGSAVPDHEEYAPSTSSTDSSATILKTALQQLSQTVNNHIRTTNAELIALRALIIKRKSGDNAR